MKTLWQKATPLTQPSELLGAVVPVGQDTTPAGEGSFWLPRPQHPWETGQWAGSVFPAILHLIIGALGFENLGFVHVLEEERSLPT